MDFYMYHTCKREFDIYSKNNYKKKNPRGIHTLYLYPREYATGTVEVSIRVLKKSMRRVKGGVKKMVSN